MTDSELDDVVIYVLGRWGRGLSPGAIASAAAQDPVEVVAAVGRLVERGVVDELVRDGLYRLAR